MTAFITHCLKNARLDLLGLLACCCLWGSWTGAALADAPVTEISKLRFERQADAVLLSASATFELPDAVEDALQKGVALIFVAEADVFRERWYWTNKRVAHAERHMRLAFQPLTRRWRLNAASGHINANGMGVALNQNFETLAEALAVVQRLSRWKIADMAELEAGQNHFVEFRFRLDVSQLPRPLQIGTLGQSDWTIEGVVSQPLVFESAK